MKRLRRLNLKYLFLGRKSEHYEGRSNSWDLSLWSPAVLTTTSPGVLNCSINVFILNMTLIKL